MRIKLTPKYIQNSSGFDDGDVLTGEALKSIGSGKTVNIIDEYPETTKDEFEDDRIDRLLALEEDTEQIEMRKAALVRQIVKDLPEPCNRLLWGFYRDGFSMKTLADMLNYSSETSVKVTKFRCCDKFKKRYSEISNRLFT